MSLPNSYQVRDVRIFPNVVLAPMEGVTDLPFRRLIREIGRVPVERNTLYGTVRRFDDSALDPTSLAPRMVGEEKAAEMSLEMGS